MITMQLNHATKNTIKKINCNINSGVIYFKSNQLQEFMNCSNWFYKIEGEAINILFDNIINELGLSNCIFMKKYARNENNFNNTINIINDKIVGYLSSSQIRQLDNKGYFIIAIQSYEGLFKVYIK